MYDWDDEATLRSPLSHGDFADPRGAARTALRRAASPATLLWNERVWRKLIAELEEHPVYRHRIFDAMRAGVLSRGALCRIHLEFRAAIVGIFTDALLMAQFRSRDLEPLLGPRGHMPLRFLLSLNLLDELGFRPGVGIDGYFRGHPEASHYALFDDVVATLDPRGEARACFVPSPYALAIHGYVESTFASLVPLLVVLAATEETAMIVCPSMRGGAEHAGLDTSHGYYLLHGVSTDRELEAHDDHHQSDIGDVLIATMTVGDHVLVQRTLAEYHSLWTAFWDHQAETLRLS
jgi:hypothetical protein